MTVVTATIKSSTRPIRGVVDAAASVAGDTTDGFTFANTGKQVVVAHQSGSTQRNIVVKDTAGNTLQTLVLPATANSQMVIGPFSVKRYGAAPVLVPAHAEVLFSVYDVTQFKSRGVSGVICAGNSY